MKISIVTPTYNAERYLSLTLDSVLVQTHQDWELIAMDDGSRDGTQSIAEAYAARDSRIQAMHQENAGVAAARNSGFALTSSQSEAVIFLDNDDLWEPETLTALIGGLAESPAAVGAYVVARYIDGDDSPVIASDIGGIPDMVRPGENGFLLPVGDKHGLGQTLSALLADEALRQRMGRAGRTIVEDRFNAAACVPRILAAMKEAVDQ